jgi:hypothetical protein
MAMADNKATPDYKFREGDEVVVNFTRDIVQPGVSKYQSNEFAPRTDVTKASTWKRGRIEQIADMGGQRLYWVRLLRPFGAAEKGWVPYDRLQPYVTV